MSGDFPGVNEPLWAVICKVDGDCIYYWIPEAGYSTKEVCLQNISEFDIGQWIVISADGNIMKVNDAPVPTFIIRSKGCRLVKIDTLVTVPPISWQSINRKIDRSTHDTVAVSSDFGVVYNGMYKSRKIVPGKLYKVFIVNMGSRGIEDDVDKALRSLDSLWAIPNQVPEEITDLEILKFSRDMLINYDVYFDLLENNEEEKDKSAHDTLPKKEENYTVLDIADEKNNLTQDTLHTDDESGAVDNNVDVHEINKVTKDETCKRSLDAALPPDSGERYEKAMAALRRLLSNNSIRDKMIEQQAESFKIVEAYLSASC